MHKFFLFILISSNLVFARDYTKPPSIALRNEISFVSEVTLISKKYLEADKWILNFTLSKDLYNESQKEISISDSRKLAKSLELNVKYIIAYQTHKKNKVNGLIKYLPYDNGPVLLRVEGANPAIFRQNKLLISQLQSSPEQAKSHPQAFIANIITGMFEQDPKIREFFVRELINWANLQKDISNDDYIQLAKVFNSSDATIDTMTAFLENRPRLHSSIGVQKLKVKVINLINSFPIDLDPLTNHPSLILHALSFSDSYKLGNWDLYSRWIQSNIPSITEKSLLILNKLDPNNTIKLVKIRLTDTNLDDSSRRVLNRFVANVNNNQIN